MTVQVLTGMFGYIELSPDVWQIPPETLCMYTNEVILTKQMSGQNVNSAVCKDLLVLCSGPPSGAARRQEVTEKVGVYVD